MAKPRHRSPSYPSLTIDDAIERAHILYRLEGKHPALASTAVSHWGYKQKSSGGLKSISALKSYGLISDAGNSQDRTVRLTDNGLAIVQDERQVSPERDKLITEAAFKPKIFSEMWAKYGDSLPSLETVKHYLVVDKAYNPSAFGDIIRAYKAALSRRTEEITEDKGDDYVETPVESATASTAPEMASRSYVFSGLDNQEIANIRVSRNCAIRLLADGQYDKKSIEALVAQLELGLKLGTYDDLDDEIEDN